MATLREIAYDLIGHVRPSYSDDDDLDVRQVYYWIKNQRALWIYNRCGEHKPLGDKHIQEYTSLNLTEDTLDTDEKVSTIIATPIIYRGQPKITFIGHDRKSKNVPLISYEAAKFHGNGRFNTETPCAYFYNNYIYVRHFDDDTIIVRGVFEDPMDIPNMTVDTEYPLDDSLLEYLKGEILKADMVIFMKAQNDNTNNEQNDLN
jgi:hypothetical protein